MARLGDHVREECHPLGVNDPQGRHLIGVSNEIGLHPSSRKTSADLSKYQIIEKNWFAYNPMRVNVGSIGLAIEDKQTGFTSPDYTVFSCLQTLEPFYLLMFLKSNYGLEEIGRNCSGAVRKRLYYSGLSEIEIPVPAVKAQRAFIAKMKSIEDTIGFINNSNSDNRELPLLRQALINESIKGELTKDWRASNSDFEPARDLVKRIRSKKNRLIAEKKIRKTKPLPAVTTDEIPFDIPQGWEWCRLLDLCEKTGSGSTPTGGKSAYSKTGIPFLRSQNVHNQQVVVDEVARISKSIHKRMAGSTVLADDILLNITGGSIGRCAIVPAEIEEANVNQHVAIVRPIISELNEFMLYTLLSPYFQERILEVQTGAGREGLPKNKMDLILFPIPPLAEQAAIVKRVNTLLTMCDELSAEIKRSCLIAEDLLQAVLKEAFAPPQ